MTCPHPARRNDPETADGDETGKTVLVDDLDPGIGAIR
jgi:hypothetical protein